MHRAVLDDPCVAGIIPRVPAGGSISLGVSIFSYNGKVAVGLRSDAGLVSNPDVIIRAFRRELEQMANLHPGPKARQRPRPTSNAVHRHPADATHR